MSGPIAPAFRSPEELKEILRQLSLGLHAKNRMTGESNYVWHVAELIRAAGELCDDISGRPEIEAEFGDGYQPGTLDRHHQKQRALDLLKAKF